MPNRNPPNVETLIAEAAGLRRLAVRLVGERDADDVLQDAVAAGIEHAPGSERALRPWLVQVLRNFSAGRHRSEGRRSARESDAARREAIPSASDLVERMEVQRVVAEEVLRLDEPYRRAVLAVYFEGLAAEEYARGLGVPGATVRSWLKRGLDALRTRLDRRFGGDRAAWNALLAPLARNESTLVTIAIGGGLLMKKIAVAAAILVALILAWLAVAPNERTGVGAVEPIAAVDSPDEVERGTTEIQAQSKDERVEIIVAPEPSRPPQLHGRVVWLPDRAPAAGIGVYAGRPDRPDLGLPTFVETDADGTFRIESLGEGEFAVGLDRARVTKKVSFASGESQEVELELARASTVRGRVLDAGGSPVTGADVFIATFSEEWANRVARSAADGTYTVAGLSVGPSIFARAAGHSPSAAYLLQSSNDPYALDLWLGSTPGAIEGHVTDVAGNPVVGIPVVLSDAEESVTDPAGVRSTLKATDVGRTDASGAFSFGDVRTGRHTLFVHSLHRTRVSVVVEVRPGRTSRADIVLPATARLLGRVTDTSGEPCGGSHVQVSRVDGTTASSWILSDADGRYDTGFVPAGRVQLAVRHGRGKLHLETDLAPGEERDWSPVLGATGPIRGRVVDRAGRPLAGVPISNGDSSTKNQVSTDTSGRFELIAKLGQGASIAAWQGDYVGARCFAWPGDPEIELVFEAPSARILGRVVDSSGTPARGVALWCDRFGVIQLDSEGRFETGLLASGSYSLSVTPYGVGRCHLVTVDLRPGETRDVGDLVLPGRGTLVVALHPHGDVDPQRVQILAYRLGSREQVVVSNGANRGGDWTAEGLPEGEYRIHLSGGGAALMEKRCTVRTGETTLVDVDAHFGNPVRVDVRGERFTELALEVRDEMGEIFGRRDLYEYDVERILHLRPGRYEIAVRASDGRTGATRVEVATEAASEQVVRIDVR